MLLGVFFFFLGIFWHLDRTLGEAHQFPRARPLFKTEFGIHGYRVENYILNFTNARISQWSKLGRRKSEGETLSLGKYWSFSVFAQSQ